MVVPGFISNGKFVFLLIFFIPDSAFSSTFSANILSPFSRIVDSDLVHSVNSATQGAHQLVHRFNNRGPFAKPTFGTKTPYNSNSFEKRKLAEQRATKRLKGDSEEISKFSAANKDHMAMDHDKDPVFLTRIQWDIDRVKRDFPLIELSEIKEISFST